MYKSLKGLLIVEILICFSPVCLMLLLGIFMSMMQIYFMVTASLLSEGFFGALYVILSTVAGILGLFGLYNVVVKLFNPEARVINHKYAAAFTLIALLALVPIAVTGDTFYWRLMGIAPIVATLHIIYLARGYLFGLNSGLTSGDF